MIAITAEGTHEVEMQPDDSLRILPPTSMVDVYDSAGALRGNYPRATPEEVMRLLQVSPHDWQVVCTINPVSP